MESSLLTALAAASISLFGALLVTAVLRSRFAARFALDTPNERSLHSRPVPRTGGIGVMAGAAAGVAWTPAFEVLLICVIPLIVISAVDDFRGLSARVRLGVHLLAAGAFAWYYVPLPWPTVMVLAICIAWMTNLYNFMDGSDGLAGGMAVIGFGVYGAMASVHGDMALAHLAWCIAAACAGFLVFNFSPASIFLGDVGSIPLGFLAGALGALGFVRDTWPWWFPIAVFAPFIVDASITLMRRVLRGERVWQAHRDHYYQRLVRMGWSHRLTARAEYLLMAFCGLAAIAGSLLDRSARIAILILVAAAIAASMRYVDVKWSRSGAR